MTAAFPKLLPSVTTAADPSELANAAAAAARAIPPLWPLAAGVAVNPFLGQSGESLPTTAARLGRVAGIALTMPRAWYRQRVADGVITDADLAAALAAAPPALRPPSLATLEAAIALPAAAPAAVPTIADHAAALSGIDWPGIIDERLGVFLGGWFDAGQALWAAPRGVGAFAAWRAFASRDLTPEIAGLSGFAAFVAATPTEAEAALVRAAGRLRLDAAASETYFHQLLAALGGWAQLARQRGWQAALAGETDATITDLLAIRIVFEEALLLHHGEEIAGPWAGSVAAHAAPVVPTRAAIVDGILQEALERAHQRQLAARLAAVVGGREGRSDAKRPALQMAFCIDVRSEVFRRALESVDPGIATLGFAGFFGMATAHRRFASDVAEARLPVLLAPSVFSCSGTAADAAADRTARIKARAERAWGRFKGAAVSSFAFVEATGPLHAVKLLADALGRGTVTPAADPPPRFEPPLEPLRRLDMAEGVLRAMSLTGGFARLVVIAGHGSAVVNNPYASTLQCGACGGHGGEVNARLLAGLVNDPAVRAGLALRGIPIPADTLFVAALHDTASDKVTLYDADHPAPRHYADLAAARNWLQRAGALCRAERALQLPRAGDASELALRGRDWSELRPEWALAGCSAFIAAPRALTAGRDLGGRVFLHDYDAGGDPEFRVLEQIMTAPVVVASWISLQYYGSVVAPSVFGAGNKLLHNVTGGVGVVEGNGGRLRSGLPWQSVHDGARLVHEPLRLTVAIAAPREAMTAILRRHEGVRALFDNGWLHLFALDTDGRLAFRYAGEFRWTAVAGKGSAAEAEHDLAPVRPVAMLEEIEPLPAAEQHAPALDGN